MADGLAEQGALEADVRRFDEPRWLASRFAPAAARARLVALYAFNHEIARVRETVSDPLLGEIRLAWWREAIGEIYDDPAGVRRHPVVLALAEALSDPAGRPPKALFDALIDARARDLEDRRFADMSELAAYATATAGGVMKIAARLVGAGEIEGGIDAGLDQAGQAWALAGLARAFPVHARQGWVVLPDAPPAPEIERTLAAHDDAAVRVLTAPLRDAARAALVAARAALAGTPPAVWPSYGYVALLRPQLAATEADPLHAALRRPGLGDRLRLVLAVARGGL